MVVSWMIEGQRKLLEQHGVIEASHTTIYSGLSDTLRKLDAVYLLEFRRDMTSG